MTEPKDRSAARPPSPAPFDRELDVRSVVSFGIGLGLAMTVVLALVWLLLAHWKTLQIARDPRPSPVAEANVPRLPPEPRLQSAPVKDMDELRAREASVLTSYAWVDKRAGIVRIPIDRAIDIVVGQGLPAPPPQATPEPQGATPAPQGSRPEPQGARPRRRGAP
jgi:hypothetical protein